MSLTTPRTRLTPRLFYRTLAIAEAVTWKLLIVGMLLKYAAGIDTPFSFAAGLAHGFVFIAYAATAVLVGINQRWGFPLIAGAVATAIVPYATVPFDRWLERTGRLEGSWRIEKSDDPRDRSVIDGLVRWMLRRPILLGTVFVVAVVGVVAGMLVAGPPSEWGA
ncbi:DUF3817 domain-containing protein [Salinibacterium sp. ZJ450]|uniref:DUF3817 domain-containing protein n=1 Tax=Salinibacterium sp. ZJ450 TaxID=2708338 RepID=UPI001CD388BE|nr:DUF3817 domain-containing protein [Salinibacterium sp. ZJ450]